MELSEEEIIRNVKRIIEYKVISNYINNYDSRVIQGLLDLYYKQQKEIEEKNVAINKMSKDISRQLKEIERLNFENHMIKKWNEQLDKNCISKDKIREKIKAFQDIKKEIIKNENKLLRASITYDIVRNDYCEKMLNQLLKENNEESNTL